MDQSFKVSLNSIFDKNTPITIIETGPVKFPTNLRLETSTSGTLIENKMMNIPKITARIVGFLIKSTIAFNLSSSFCNPLTSTIPYENTSKLKNMLKDEPYKTPSGPYITDNNGKPIKPVLVNMFAKFTTFLFSPFIGITNILEIRIISRNVNALSPKDL